MRTMLWVVALAAVAAPVLAQTDDSKAPIAAPVWEHFARPPETNVYLPHEAEQKHTGGSVRLRCSVKADGAMDVCRIDDETPRGMGLGQAALGITNLYKMRPTDPRGRPVEGREVEFTVVFGCTGNCVTDRDRPGRAAGPGRGGRRGPGL